MKQPFGVWTPSGTQIVRRRSNVWAHTRIDWTDAQGVSAATSDGQTAPSPVSKMPRGAPSVKLKKIKTGQAVNIADGQKNKVLGGFKIFL